MRRRRRLTLLVVVAAVVLGLATTADAKTQSGCTQSKGVGKYCVTVTDAGRRAYRLRVEWKYDETRNVGVPRPVKRSVWEANILCKTSLASIDTVKFYDERNAEIVLSAAVRQQIASGLTKNALPPLVKSICSN